MAADLDAAIATVSILTFLGAWNEYFLALIPDPFAANAHAAVDDSGVLYDYGRADWAQVFAALTIGSLPMIIIYLVMQRQFIQVLPLEQLRDRKHV